MRKKINGFDILFFIIAICNIVFLYRLTEYTSVAKPMVTVSLLGYYIYSVRNQDVKVILALVFALFGDIFLLIGSEHFFILGLGSFLVMQILYTVIFLKNLSKSKTSMIWSAIIILVFALIVYFALQSQLGELKIPVLLYMIALSSMVWSAFNRSRKILGYTWVAFGSILFMASDTILAWNKFLTPWNHHQAVIMLTYMAAQYLIIMGIVKGITLKKEK